MANHRHHSPRAKAERAQTEQCQGPLPDFAYRRTHRLDRRFTVEFCLNGVQLEVLWAPHVPNGRKLRSLLPAYRNARNHFLASLGVNVLVIER